MTIPDPRCFLLSLLSWIVSAVRGVKPLDYHAYVVGERWTNCNVYVRRCERDGHVDIDWKRTEASQPITE